MVNKDQRLIFKTLFCHDYLFNPEYALENLLRNETTSKQDVLLIYFTSS